MPDEIVQCLRRQKELPLEVCLDAFTEAHAFEKEEDPCWACPLGAANRHRVAFREEPTTEEIETMLSYCGVRKSKRGSTSIRKRKYHVSLRDPYTERAKPPDKRPTVKRRRKADRKVPEA